MSRGITILGATGSVGQSTLDLIGRAPNDWHVHAVTANSDAAGLAAIARACNAELAVVGDDDAYQDLKAALAGSGIAVASGKAALVEAAERPADIVMSAIVGAAGLAPTLAAVRRGAVIALANKESLVCAGDIVTAAARQSGARLLPVDSEHNAIYQIFDHDHPERVARVILTASGGPFRKASVEAMRVATPGQACNHPVWSMGAKISVDSATLMNKGLELIEAHHLFPVNADQLGVIVHPQSVVHSFVEYIDGSVLAQLGTPDMRTPIAYTLAHPERMATPCKRLSLAEVGKLEFEEPDLERFPALALAWDALRAGGAMPTALNAANEVAVAAFLAGEIGFLDIAALVRDVLDALDGGVMTTLDDVMAVDTAARRAATQRLKTLVPA
ncbi:1-deoxy-D-xylulose-5-phosphate reductoisomerase [Polymorphobacter arshaanensis]|uniref:1-deoxy-D-xylulose 5-phosphate reductoisomerase n=1 Tax=Glacieibacterium arshaanense TaxID=2511025 RepID=A0A4Y9ERH9_9SPHN|nr:1-deoxy-D-xylulose-5-phosphate reductoisomerase [Polymorphobacter arshaanensis]TFU06246.1 1-deoxy-D-xylulose-5-phosphate reductoisomerase [Polymorphobacter arshaanensis]